METNKKNVRDGSMDILKFCLAIAIILFHGKRIFRGDASIPLFTQGASAVEGFFIISGYYMAKSAIEIKKKPLEFMKSRILGIFPYHVFAFVLCFFALSYLWGYFRPFTTDSFLQMAYLLVRSVPEFLILPPIGGIGYNMAGIINMEWYLSAMLLGMAILYPIVLHFKDRFCSYAAPLIFIFISGLMYQKVGSYRATVGFANYSGWGFIRAIALLSIGTTVYWLATNSKTPKKQSTKTLLTIFSAACWYITFRFFNSNDPKEYIFSIIYFMIAGVYLEAIRGTFFSDIFNNKVSTFLGKISLPMYLNQGWIRRIMLKAKLSWSYPKCMVVYIGITVFFSLLSLLVAHLYKKNRARKREALAEASQ